MVTDQWSHLLPRRNSRVSVFLLVLCYHSRNISSNRHLHAIVFPHSYHFLQAAHANKARPVPRVHLDPTVTQVRFISEALQF